MLWTFKTWNNIQFLFNTLNITLQTKSGISQTDVWQKRKRWFSAAQFVLILVVREAAVNYEKGAQKERERKGMVILDTDIRYKFKCRRKYTTDENTQLKQIHNRYKVLIFSEFLALYVQI